MIKKQRVRLLSVLYAVCMIVFTPVLLNAQDETVSVDAVFTNNAREIPGLIPPFIVIDFENLPLGPTTLQDINDANPGSTLTGISIVPIAGTDTYNANTQGGRALGPNADGSGGLIILDPGETFSNSSSWTFNLDAPTNQFGIQIGDQSSEFNFEFFLDSQLVATIPIDINSNSTTRFIQTRTPFNRVVISLNTGWVAPTLFLSTGPPSRPIPTLSEWGLIAMAGSLGLLGIFFAVRKRKSLADAA